MDDSGNGKLLNTIGRYQKIFAEAYITHVNEFYEIINEAHSCLNEKFNKIEQQHRLNEKKEIRDAFETDIGRDMALSPIAGRLERTSILYTPLKKYTETKETFHSPQQMKDLEKEQRVSLVNKMTSPFQNEPKYTDVIRPCEDVKENVPVQSSINIHTLNGDALYGNLLDHKGSPSSNEGPDMTTILERKESKMRVDQVLNFPKPIARRKESLVPPKCSAADVLKRIASISENIELTLNKEEKKIQKTPQRKRAPESIRVSPVEKLLGPIKSQTKVQRGMDYNLRPVDAEEPPKKHQSNLKNVDHGRSPDIEEFTMSQNIANVFSSPTPSLSAIKTDDEDSYMNYDMQHRKNDKKIPLWVRTPVLSSTLKMQENVNPDEIFGENVEPVPMEDIFGHRKFRNRLSSTDWKD